MRDRPVLLVAGLGRCGTTLMMHMLRAAGVPVAGSAPAFEDVPIGPRGMDLEWLSRQGGKAVKWIDPTITRIRRDNARAIWLSRDPMEQARSQAKLMGARLGRSELRALASLVKRDTWRARRVVDRLCGSHGVLHLTFEGILRHPDHNAARIASFCHSCDIDFVSVRATADIVRKRTPECAPDLSIEAVLMEEARNA